MIFIFRQSTSETWSAKYQPLGLGLDIFLYEDKSEENPFHTIGHMWGESSYPHTYI